MPFYVTLKILTVIMKDSITTWKMLRILSDKSIKNYFKHIKIMFSEDFWHHGSLSWHRKNFSH